MERTNEIGFGFAVALSVSAIGPGFSAGRFVHRARVPKLIKTEPQAARVLMKPNRKQDGEGERSPQSHFPRQPPRQSQHQESDKRDDGRESIVKIDRAQEESRFSLKANTALGAIRVHAKNLAEQLSDTANRTTQSQATEIDGPKTHANSSALLRR